MGINDLLNKATEALGLAGSTPAPMSPAQRADDKAHGIAQASELRHEHNGIVRTGPGQSENIRLEDGSLLALGPSTTFDLKQLSPAALQQLDQIKSGSLERGQLNVKSGLSACKALPRRTHASPQPSSAHAGTPSPPRP